MRGCRSHRNFLNTDKEATHSHIPAGSRSVAKVPSNFVAPYTRVLHFRFSQRYLVGLSNVRLPGLPSDISVNRYIITLRVCTEIDEHVVDSRRYSSSNKRKNRMKYRDKSIKSPFSQALSILTSFKTEYLASVKKQATR